MLMMLFQSLAKERVRIVTSRGLKCRAADANDVVAKFGKSENTETKDTKGR